MLSTSARSMRTDTRPQPEPRLRSWIESQLAIDMRFYHVTAIPEFDWSQSYGSGKQLRFLDGTLQNFSRIIVFDHDGNLLADGCMEFICDNGIAICYWDLITVWRGGYPGREKKYQGIPSHIWRQLPEAVMSKYVEKRM